MLVKYLWLVSGRGRWLAGREAERRSFIMWREVKEAALISLPRLHQQSAASVRPWELSAGVNRIQEAPQTLPGCHSRKVGWESESK